MPARVVSYNMFALNGIAGEMTAVVDRHQVGSANKAARQFLEVRMATKGKMGREVIRAGRGSNTWYDIVHKKKDDQ